MSWVHRYLRRNRHRVRETNKYNVVEMGPDPDSTGGMATVIAEYLAMEFSEVRVHSLTTWKPDKSIFQSITIAGRAFFALLLNREKTDLVHLHLSEWGSFVREGLLAVAARGLRIPVVVTLHGASFGRQSSRLPRLTGGVLSTADVIVVLGEHHARIVRSLVGDRRPIEVLPNPVVVGSESELVEHSSRPIDFLFVGEIGTRKGFDLLARAVQRIRPVMSEVHVAAVGPIASGTEPEFGEIEYQGSLSRRDVMKLMGRSKCLVLPSRAEVLPMAILEAMTQGCSVVMSRVGEWKHFVSAPGVLQVAPNDADMLASAMMESHASAVSVRDVVSWVEQFASSSTIARRLESIYTRAIERKCATVAQGVEK